MIDAAAGRSSGSASACSSCSRAARRTPSAPGLGVLPGARAPASPTAPGLKIPHMGWNATAARAGGGGRARPAAVPDGTYFYFVHSYYPDPARAEDVALSSRPRRRFCAARSARDNVFGCQFHPEKSQAAGLALLRRFVAA